MNKSTWLTVNMKMIHMRGNNVAHRQTALCESFSNKHQEIHSRHQRVNETYVFLLKNEITPTPHIQTTQKRA